MRRHYISFSHAWDGIVHNFTTQPNFRVHLIFAILAILAGLYFKITSTQWLIITFTITLVIVAEMINTALESMVDLITSEHRQHAKIAKDTSAGMVLITAILAIIVAAIVFLPYLSK